MLRNTIIADEGMKLIVPDYKSIEDRTRPWLAGDQKKIEEYKKIDQGIGHDMYKVTYARTFGIEVEEVTKYQRSLGKILALAFGYQGGVGAFIKFATSYNLNLQEIVDIIEIPEPYYSQAEEWYYKSGSDLDCETFIAIDGIKRMWREDNPATVQYWYDVENAAKLALQGYRSRVGVCTFDSKKNWLRIKLPSGRYISYAKAKLYDNQIMYWHKDKMVDTYGGKLVENITQAVARDVLTYGMFQAEKYGYKLILTVHDELVAEVPNTKEYTLEQLCKYVSTLPDWAYGLPMPADGFEGYRYKKDD
jgi:DNA polymerase